MNNTRYIPDNSQPVTRLDLPAVVYTYINAVNMPAAIAYAGKSNKPTWHYRFGCDADRQKKIDQFFDAIAFNEDRKLERKVERQSFRHGYKDGDILYSSWGYDQTNIEYYQVISHTSKTVTFREVCQHRDYDSQFMSGTCTPAPNQFLKESKEFTRPVRPSSDKEKKGTIHFAEHDGGYMKYLWEWDGSPKGYSTYA